MIIDVHTHGYPEPVIKDPRAWALSRGEPYWADLVYPEKGGSIQGWAHCDDFVRSMDKAGVDQVVLLGWYWEQEATCREQNAWHLNWRDRHPDRFHVFATVQPRAGECAFDNVRRAVDCGCIGIGEMHPYVQGFPQDDPVWLKILVWAEESGLPVNFHVTEPAGHEYHGKVDTPLGDFLTLAKNFPKLNIILAHWGGGLPFFELNRECKKQLSNIYYDTAASPLLYEDRIWSQVVSVIGEDRILFGSDFPLRLYPRQETEPSWERILGEVRSAGLSEGAVSKILGKNAQGLFSL